MNLTEVKTSRWEVLKTIFLKSSWKEIIKLNVRQSLNFFVEDKEPLEFLKSEQKGY